MVNNWVQKIVGGDGEELRNLRNFGEVEFMDLVTGQGSALDKAQVSDWMVVPFIKIGNTGGGADFVPVSVPCLSKWHHHFKPKAMISCFHPTSNSSASPVRLKIQSNLYNLILKVELTGLADKFKIYSRSGFLLLSLCLACSKLHQRSPQLWQPFNQPPCFQTPPTPRDFDYSPHKEGFFKKM